MNKNKHTPAALLAALLLATAAPSVSAMTEEDIMRKIEDTLQQLEQAHTQASAKAGKPGKSGLTPAQKLQGEITIDRGNGPVRMVSVSETLDEDYSKNIGSEVDNPLVREIMESMDGKTANQSSANYFMNFLEVSLNASANPGSMSDDVISLSFTLDRNTLAYQEGFVTFKPAGNSMMDLYNCDEDCQPKFKLDRLAYNNEEKTSLSITGSFSAPYLQHSFKDDRLGAIKGSFEFSDLPVEPML